MGSYHKSHYAEVKFWRTHFEVLGLDLEASSPRKLLCPRLEDSTIFWIVEMFRSSEKCFWSFFWRSPEKNFWRLFLKFFWSSPEKKFWSPFLLFFWRTLSPVFLVLVLEHFCPWPREGLSSEGLSLALVFFFVFLALASSLVSSNTPLTLCTFCISFTILLLVSTKFD